MVQRRTDLDWVAAITMDVKGDGSFRTCFDYRTLNKWTDLELDTPDVNSKLQAVKNAKYYCIDLRMDFIRFECSLTRVGSWGLASMVRCIHRTVSHLVVRIIQGGFRQR